MSPNRFTNSFKFPALIQTIVLIAFTTLANPLSAQVLKYAELNTRQITALDRNKTAIIIAGAPLEQHGPYLPSYADGYWAERHAQDLAENIVAAKPGWTAVLLPPVPLSCEGANTIGFKHVFSGSLTPRCNTVRQVFMDMGDSLAGQGFKWVFIVNYHGAPNNNRALDVAADYFHDTYGGQMVHLFGIIPVRFCCDLREKFLTPEQRKADGFTVHADAEETSMMLALRPDLVPADFKSALDQSGADFEDLITLAGKKDWPGYFGSPRAASAALGLAEYRAMVKASSEMALKIIDGFDYRTLPNYYTEFMKNPSEARVQAGEHDRKQEARQNQWLKKKGH
ncbi:MAG TPA: creatininase family protein [Terriglobales bacterium]|nr:creatininase family protein [Terriglobales bacterium]